DDADDHRATFRGLFAQMNPQNATLGGNAATMHADDADADRQFLLTDTDKPGSDRRFAVRPVDRRQISGRNANQGQIRLAVATDTARRELTAIGQPHRQTAENLAVFRQDIAVLGNDHPESRRLATNQYSNRRSADIIGDRLE